MVHVRNACFEYILEATDVERMISFLLLQEMNTSAEGKEHQTV